MICCAGKIENFSFAKSIGVGLIESAINLTQCIFYEKPSEIVFVGTCGCYDDSKSLLEIFESQSATNIELSFLQNNSYTPLDNCISLENVSHETLTKNIVNSSNYITTNKELAQKFIKLGILYENMEFFSVLQVARTYQIPALGVFCSTNHIHKEAQKEFFSNHKIAMNKLEEYIRDKKNG